MNIGENITAPNHKFNNVHGVEEDSAGKVTYLARTVESGNKITPTDSARSDVESSANIEANGCKALNSVAYAHMEIGNVPYMSLDELKAIDAEFGYPVFLIVGTYRAWEICHGYEWIQGHVTDWIIMSGYGKLSCNTYGKEWVCYAYNPGTLSSD